MKILTWALRLLIFLFLLAFAVQNTEPVVLHFIFGQTWEAPLVILMLLFLIGGTVLGLLSVVGLIFRQRREIARLKRELARAPAPLVVEQPPLV